MNWLILPAIFLKVDDRWWLILKNNSWELKVHKIQDYKARNMFCWHLLAAFILLSIEDFYQISANEFIDSIVVTLGKVDVRLHINHCENRHKKTLFPLTKANIGLWLDQGIQFFVILLTFNMIVQPCSQRAKTTSCRLHVTHYFKYGHRT